MEKETKNDFSTGLTLVEVLVATSIVLIFIVVLFGVYNTYLRIVSSNTQSVKATYLAEEGLEVIRFLRDSSWDDNILPLSSETDYKLIFESGTWQFSATSIYIDAIFDRSVIFHDVYRDTNGDIVSSGGNLDENTKLVTINVSWWRNAATSTKSLSTYIMNLFDN